MNLGPYQIDNIYCGECTDMMSRLPDNCIDLTVTSPPYDLVDENMVTYPGKGLRDYQGYDWDFVNVAKQLWRVTKEGGVVVWVVGDATVDGSETGSSFRQALYFKDVGFRLHDTMIWHKINPIPGKSNRYIQSFEFMFVFSKRTLCNFNPLFQGMKKETIDRQKYRYKPKYRISNGETKQRYTNTSHTNTKKQNVWSLKSGTGNTSKDKFVFNHPASFPEALARDHILSWSNPDAIILDPFIGSGTVAKMAIETDRHYLGFDISQEYVDLANRRIQSARCPLPGLA